MSEAMTFPDDWRDFLKSYSFTDSEQIYTNGALLIPVFRVEQLIEHLFEDAAPLKERFNELAEAYQKLKAADMVPIVRCRDCKHTYSYDFCPKITDNDGCMILFIRNGDYFCPYGEKRGD